MVCVPPSTVCAIVNGLKFIGTPCATRNKLPTSETGNNTHKIARIRPTQKLPISVVPSLYRKKDRIEKGLPSFENPFQVSTYRLDKKRHDKNKEPSLNGICAHVTFCDSNTGAGGEITTSASRVVPHQKDCAAIALSAFAASKLLSRKSQAKSKEVQIAPEQTGGVRGHS
jgi:hypothetical protein